MFLDRQLQLSILQELRKKYPEKIHIGELHKIFCTNDFVDQNLVYLTEHGLVETDGFNNASIFKEFPLDISIARITAAGIDFLEDDGGLTAILGKVVVKFDEDDLGMILRAINLSEASDEEKSKLKAMLRSLPAEGLKTVYTRLLNLGLDNLPVALQLIQKSLENG